MSSSTVTVLSSQSSSFCVGAGICTPPKDKGEGFREHCIALTRLDKYDVHLEAHPELKADRERQIARWNRRNQDEVGADALVFDHDQRGGHRADVTVVADTPFAIVVA